MELFWFIVIVGGACGAFWYMKKRSADGKASTPGGDKPKVL